MLRIDGRAIAARIMDETRERLAGLPAAPGLAVVQVGSDAASSLYIRLKERACAELGVRFQLHALPAAASARDMMDAIERLNADEQVDGIVVQLPLPPHLDADACLAAVAFDKDVDGLGRAFQDAFLRGDAPWTPALPASIAELLRASGRTLAGCSAAVIAKSPAFCSAVAALGRQLDMNMDAAPSYDHADLPSRDVVITALGQAHALHEDMLKPGATVIDVGIANRGDRVLGDFAGDEGRGIVGAYSPVPGGVGPVTVAMLLANLSRAARRHHP